MPEEAAKPAADMGPIEEELLRLRDELRRTEEGRAALRYIEDILTLMTVQKMDWALAQWYVDSWWARFR